MQDTTRRCGNCGEGVGATDITCPRCGALLAAYEAPAGSTAGSDSAVTPVSILTEPLDTPEPAGTALVSGPIVASAPPRPYNSPTARSLSSLDEERPRIETISSTGEPERDSPIAQALEETRRAADLQELDIGSTLDDPDAPPAPSELPVDLAQAREALGLSPNPTPAESQPEPAPDPVGLQGARQTLVSTLNQQTVKDSPPVTKPAPRPAPEDRGAHSGPPVPQRTIQNANPRRNQTASSPAGPGTTGRAFIGILVFFIFVMPILRSGAFPGVFIILVVIAGLFWYMKTMARNTGRKSTTMPKDRNRRR